MVVAEAGTVVIIEDDPNISDLLDMYLRREGFRVIQSADGASGLAAVAREQPRIVVLDLGLPGGVDGLEVCKRLRTTSRVPVLMLSARDAEIDRVVGLEVGADDYVTKPFSPREVIARIRAILRRAEGPGETATVRTIGDVEIDTGRREARVNGEPITLAAREFDLLQYFADNAGLVLTRQQLLDGVWGPGWYGDERTVDVHVRQLRKKLGDGLPLATVWGVGYRLA